MMNIETEAIDVWVSAGKEQNIHAGEIHIWKIEVNALIPILPFLNCTLSVDELAHSVKFRFEKDRNTYIVIRGALRVILGKYLSELPSSIKFKYNPFGKPYMQSNSNQPILHFNVSHSGNIGLLIFSIDHEVGIDLEQVKTIDNVLSIASQNFSAGEIAELKCSTSDQQIELFYEYWTKKEALIKAKGVGLSHPLNQFCVSMSQDRIYDGVWRLSKIPIDVGYQAAYAFSSDINKINYWVFDNLKMAAHIHE